MHTSNFISLPNTATNSNYTTPMVNLTDAFNKYHSYGWVTLPIETAGKKNLTLKAWTNRTIDDCKLSDFSNTHSNIGVLLGENSGGLVDIDIDDHVAMKLAEWFLPPTGMIFGHAAKPTSHWIYIVDDCGQTKRFQCPENNTTLVEYRSTGTQTVFPPSLHSIHGQRSFVSEQYPSKVSAADLLTNVSRLAAATLIVRKWKEGHRQDTAMALCGALLKAGWSAEEMKSFLTAICTAAGDTELDQRLACVESTLKKIASGEKITGFPTLSDHIGSLQVSKIIDWLGIRTVEITNTDSNAHNRNFALNDSDTSTAFANKFSDRVKYCPEFKSWLIWDGRVWKSDISNGVFQYAEDSARKTFGKLAISGDPYILKQSANCLNHNRLRGMVELAKGKMAVSQSELDRHPTLLNCTNGILDLETGKLIAHSSELLLTQQIPIAYNPNAKTKLWDSFIDQITCQNPELAHFLQVAMGYSLSGATNEQCIFIVVGNGRNGKSTFLDVMGHLMGQYWEPVSSKTVMYSHQYHTPSDIAFLQGKRLAVCAETSEGQRLDESKIKVMTGGEYIEGRLLYQNEIKFLPQFKLWICTNNLPKIKGTDEGIWRRIRTINFDLRLNDNEVDKNLGAKLKEEAPAILNWALQGYREWKKNGLVIPHSVVEATKKYRMDMDYVEQFLVDNTITSTGSKVPNKEIYERFKDWFTSDIGGDVPTQKELTQKLKEKGITQGKSKSTRYWKDIQLNEEINIPL